MRIATAIACTTLTLLVAATPTSAERTAGTPSRKCPSRRSHFLAGDAQAQVYEPPENAHFEFPVYGCTYPHGRSYNLGQIGECGSSQGCEGIERSTLTLTGPMVAYERFFFEEFGERDSKYVVVVVDLRTGRELHRVPTGTAAMPSPGRVGVGQVTALVLKRDGAVAWIAEDEERSTFRHPPYYDVGAVDHSGIRLLASGTDIGPHSLGLKGSKLSWKKGRRRFSATLR
jgi:hypothetical protein